MCNYVIIFLDWQGGVPSYPDSYQKWSHQPSWIKRSVRRGRPPGWFRQLRRFSRHEDNRRGRAGRAILVVPQFERAPVRSPTGEISLSNRS